MAQNDLDAIRAKIDQADRALDDLGDDLGVFQDNVGNADALFLSDLAAFLERIAGMLKLVADARAELATIAATLTESAPDDITARLNQVERTMLRISQRPNISTARKVLDGRLARGQLSQMRQAGDPALTRILKRVADRQKSLS